MIALSVCGIELPRPIPRPDTSCGTRRSVRPRRLSGTSGDGQAWPSRPRRPRIEPRTKRRLAREVEARHAETEVSASASAIRDGLHLWECPWRAGDPFEQEACEERGYASAILAWANRKKRDCYSYIRCRRDGASPCYCNNLCTRNLSCWIAFTETGDPSCN